MCILYNILWNICTNSTCTEPFSTLFFFPHLLFEIIHINKKTKTHILPADNQLVRYNKVMNFSAQYIHMQWTIEINKQNFNLFKENSIQYLGFNFQAKWNRFRAKSADNSTQYIMGLRLPSRLARYQTHPVTSPRTLPLRCIDRRKSLAKPEIWW